MLAALIFITIILVSKYLWLMKNREICEICV